MKNIVFIAALSQLLFFSCGIYTAISVQSDAGTDFTKYQTFAWLHDDVDTTNSPYNNQIIRNNIRNYFGKCFAERGFNVNLDTPDVLLQVMIVNQKKSREISYYAQPMYYYYSRYYFGSDYYSPYPFNYYYHQLNVFCYPFGYCTEKIDYVEGAITLNVIDRKENKLVWSGTAKGDIYDASFINRNIHPAVQSIMKKFPVKQIDGRKDKKKYYPPTAAQK